MEIEFLGLLWEKFNLAWHKFAWQAFWAIFIFFIGWLVSEAALRATIVFLNRIHLNSLFRRMGWEEALAKIDVRLSISKFFGEIVRWSLLTIFLMFSAKTAGLYFFSQFLWRIIVYFPNIFVAVLIFVAAVFLADFSQKIVVGTLEKEKITYSRFLGRIMRWVIWFLAILAILYQLRIVPKLILVIFIGIVSMFSISIGVAFGLGGKEIAYRFLKELEDKFK